MTEKIESKFRVPVNRGSLSLYVGKPVTIFGTVIKVDNSGSSFQLKTTDKQDVTIMLRKPLMEKIDGLVEIHGTVHEDGKTITCDYHMAFPEEISKNYDPDVANSTISIIHSTLNVWKGAQ